MSCVLCKRFGGAIGVLGWAAVAALLVGCGDSSPSDRASAGKTTPEIRGEPIRGEPIDIASQPVGSPGPTVEPTSAEPPSSRTDSPPQLAATKVEPTSEPSAPTVAPREPGPQESPSIGTPDNPRSVGFEKLASFQYDLPDGPAETNAVAPKVSTQIPEAIRALDDEFVSLKGFMLPLKVEKGLVTELLIMRDQSMCCYGTVPKINEWVSVKMVGPGVKPIMDQAVTLFGKLKVGEMYENGYLVGIYSMDGERMAGPLDM
jgi:hypothetical protein